MTAAELVAQLADEGARLVLNGSDLRYRGPRELATDDLRRTLRALCTDLVRYLQSCGGFIGEGLDRRLAISRSYHVRLLRHAGELRKRVGLAETPVGRHRLASASSSERAAARNVRLARRFFVEIAP